MSDDRSTVEICQILAGMVPGAAWQGVVIVIGYIKYLILTPRGRVDAAKIVSSIASAFLYIYGTVEGATSSLYRFFTDAWGAAKNVGTPNMTTIMQIFGQMARDEANKAYHQTKNTTTTNTVDVEYEKAENEVIKEIANNVEENVEGSGKWMQVFLKIFKDKIKEIFTYLWSCISSLIVGVVSFCANIFCCCNMRKTDKQKVLPPKEDTKRAVTPTKRTRARSKSPARKSKSK